MRSFFYAQLSSIGVFGTEANTGFMHMRRSGSRFTFVKITRLMSDRLEMALVTYLEMVHRIQSRSIRLALFCSFFLISQYVLSLGLGLSEFVRVVSSLQHVEETLERYDVR